MCEDSEHSHAVLSQAHCDGCLRLAVLARKPVFPPCCIMKVKPLSLVSMGFRRTNKKRASEKRVILAWVMKGN